MNKSDLVNNISNKSDSFLEDDIEKSVKLILELISKSLSKNQRVEIRNFGTFSIRPR